MRLIIVQHGEALSEQDNPERPLSPQGELDIQQLAAFIKPLQIPFDRVLHSDKLRARQTASHLSQASSRACALEETTDIKPNSDVAGLIGQLNDTTETWLLASHMPFVGRLCSQLLCGDENRSAIHFIPGTAACLQCDAEG